LGVMEGTGNDKAIQASIEIDLSSYEGIPMAAQEVKESFLNRLRENLNRSYEEYRQSLLGRQEAYERQVAQTEAQMNTLQEAILEITGGKKMSREFLEDQITGLSSELQEKEFEIGVHENRLKNLNNQIQEAEQYHREKQATNPIPAELEKKVASLEQQFQNMKRMAEAGQVSGQEIQEIEQHLIEARIELAERREMTEQSPEAQRIRELKEQLTQLSLSFSEQQMRMSFLREQIDNVRSLLERSTEYETLRIKADVQRKALYESIEQLERIQRENRLLTPPILTVISQ
jgi:chromosome segregation ATPase